MQFLALRPFHGYKQRMFRVIAQHSRFTAQRRVAAVLLALILNVAILPCAMAIEVAEEAHDCCPPEIQLEASECCVIDDATLDARGVRLGLDGDNGADLLLAPVYAVALEAQYLRNSATTGPPDTLLPPVPVHKLNCAYLE